MSEEQRSKNKTDEIRFEPGGQNTQIKDLCLRHLFFCCLTSNVLRLIENDSFVFNLEPLHGIIFRDSMLDSNTSLASSATCHTVTRTLKNNIEVHTVDSSRRVIPKNAFKWQITQIAIFRLFLYHQCWKEWDTYLIPKSMCSWIPKPKQPVSLKFLLKSSYSLTLSPLSRSCIALSPLTVT